MASSRRALFSLSPLSPFSSLTRRPRVQVRLSPVLGLEGRAQGGEARFRGGGVCVVEGRACAMVRGALVSFACVSTPSSLPGTGWSPQGGVAREDQGGTVWRAGEKEVGTLSKGGGTAGATTIGADASAPVLSLNPLLLRTVDIHGRHVRDHWNWLCGLVGRGPGQGLDDEGGGASAGGGQSAHGCKAKG